MLFKKSRIPDYVFKGAQDSSGSILSELDGKLLANVNERLEDEEGNVTQGITEWYTVSSSAVLNDEQQVALISALAEKGDPETNEDIGEILLNYWLFDYVDDADNFFNTLALHALKSTGDHEISNESVRAQDVTGGLEISVSFDIVVYLSSTELEYMNADRMKEF